MFDENAYKQQLKSNAGGVQASSDVLGKSPRVSEVDFASYQTSPYEYAMKSLAEQSSKSQRQASDCERAMGILAGHPEYFDLIWLLRSGLV